MHNDNPTPELAIRAITSLFDTTFQPLHSTGADFVLSCLHDVYPELFSKYHLPAPGVHSHFWYNNPYRVSCSNFGDVGDVLVWHSCKSFPHGSVGIRIPGQKVITSSIDFRFSITGRLAIDVAYFEDKPPIVLRICK